jgi:transcriptional antiterminator RfaH
VDNAKASDNNRWYAIYTKSKTEDRADSNLRAWGVETFAPRVKERRSKTGSGASAYIIKPLFHRYIFARFDATDMLHKVQYTRGVHSVVAFGGNPLAVDDETIELIKSRIENGFVRMDEEFKLGDEVMIQDGSLRGLSGVFSRALGSSERVLILLTNVNYQAHITVEKQLITKATQSLRAA